jgi:hypothetical protein
MTSIVQANLEGQLTQSSLLRALNAAVPDETRVCLLINCLPMTGYDLDARNTFVEWNKAHRPRIAGVAIVTIKPAWQMVVAVMAMASGQQMRAFAAVDEARSWLASLPG